MLYRTKEAYNDMGVYMTSSNQFTQKTNGNKRTLSHRGRSEAWLLLESNSSTFTSRNRPEQDILETVEYLC